MEEVFELLKSSAAKNAVVDFAAIPDISLYMDQLTTFIEERLRGYKRNKTDKILTKTMINNYTKDNLLPASHKKKYDKEHIALLILIYHLKSCVTISDISMILDVVEFGKISVETVYRVFADIQKAENERIDENIKAMAALAENSNADAELTALTLILKLVAEANSRKLMAERLIDYIHGGLK